MQREFGFFGSTPLPDLLPEDEIALCANFKDALALCIRRSRVKRSQGDLAALVGIHPTQFSKILHGAKGQGWHLEPGLIAELERQCGNHAITQWLAYQSGLQIVPDSQAAREKRALERKIVSLERELAKRTA